MSRCLLIFGFFMLFILSCSLSQFGWQVEPQAETKKDERGLVEDFDPMTLNDEEIEVEPLPEQSAASTEGPLIASSAISDMSDNQVEDGEEVLGFRVQLLSVSDEQSAREAKRRAMMRFNENVYMILDGPSYKIRVGDCRTRDEAKTIKTMAVEKGYADAWIVQSKVIANQGIAENP